MAPIARNRTHESNRDDEGGRGCSGVIVRVGSPARGRVTSIDEGKSLGRETEGEGKLKLSRIINKRARHARRACQSTSAERPAKVNNANRFRFSAPEASKCDAHALRAAVDVLRLRPSSEAHTYDVCARTTNESSRTSFA